MPNDLPEQHTSKTEYLKDVAGQPKEPSGVADPSSLKGKPKK